MKYEILYEIRGRIRFHVLARKKMTSRDADILEAWLKGQDGILSVKVYERTGNCAVSFCLDRESVIALLNGFDLKHTIPGQYVPHGSTRKIRQYYEEQLISSFGRRAMEVMFLPAPVMNALTTVRSVKYFLKAAQAIMEKKPGTSVLDAVTLIISYLRADYAGAGTVVFLLGIGEILENLTTRKAVENLTETMSLNLDYVTLKAADGEPEILVPASDIVPGNILHVSAGEMIPFDGTIVRGAGNVLQTSFTGNAIPVGRVEGAKVYAGTVLDEGSIDLLVESKAGASWYDRVIAMAELTDRTQPEFESRALARAGKFAPWILAGSGLTWLITRDLAKAASVLTIDLSYSLKMALSTAVLSSVNEAEKHHLHVRGGRSLEAIAAADTIVFDKTGTLTKAEPELKEIISCGDYAKDDLLCIAACIEEHFSNATAKAIVRASEEKGLLHDEMHSDIDYEVAHGIATYIEENRVVFGTYHFVCEDEHCTMHKRFADRILHAEHGHGRHLYLAVNNRIEAIFCIEDTLKGEAVSVVQALRADGISNILMLTGDTEPSTVLMAEELGIADYRCTLMPEDKASIIRGLQADGHTVIMVGDGVNDSLALAAADAGISLPSGARSAIELADVVLTVPDLRELITLRQISKQLVKQMQKNYKTVMGINTGLAAFCMAGTVTANTAATIHAGASLAVAGANMIPDRGSHCECGCKD